MSVTVLDILKLPCLQDAQILGGRGGLGKTVSSITVLEYSAANDLQQEIINNIEFSGSEIVLTAFANVKDDVDAQCRNIKRLAKAGEVGMILYYVGIILLEVDCRLIELADSLEFTLICMPKNRSDLRYSEVICEVMEAVFQDQRTDTWFQNEILERISGLPVYQRSIDNVMRMLCDRVKASLILTDTTQRILNSVSWPRNLKIEENILEALFQEETQEVAQIEIRDECYGINQLTLHTRDTNLKLYVFKQDAPLKAEAVNQIGEVLQISLNLWSQSHAQDLLPELVRAILQDEPVKMRRIADVFRVNVASINQMWIATPEISIVNPAKRDKQEQAILKIMKQELSGICNIVIADVYDESIIIFMDDTRFKGDVDTFAEGLLQELEEKGVPACFTMCSNLADTAQVRNAYLLNEMMLPCARIVYPMKTLFSYEELRFVESCQCILDKGEEETYKKIEVLECLKQEDRLSNDELKDTLTIYLLDANSSVTDTAAQMHLHKNTIKYRLKQISNKLSFSVNRMPGAMTLYMAVALHRILHSNRK